MREVPPDVLLGEGVPAVGVGETDGVGESRCACIDVGVREVDGVCVTCAIVTCPGVVAVGGGDSRSELWSFGPDEQAARWTVMSNPMR